MIVLEDLSQPASPKRPCALTIGSFDGVHKGHQHLLHKARKLVGEKGSLCALTFSNHPSHIIPGADPVTPLFTKSQKLHWLAAYRVDIVYCIPFTLELAAQTYQEFLESMSRACPYDHLVLGQGAHLGNERQGSPELVTSFCNARGVTAHYIEKLNAKEQPVSSQVIRRLLASGNHSAVVNLMGHPFE